MNTVRTAALLTALALVSASGAMNLNGAPFAAAQSPSPWSFGSSSEPYAEQVRQLNGSVREMNAANQKLNADLARMQQKLELLADEKKAIQQQLAETAAKLQEAQAARRKAEKKLDTLEASSRHRGGATITANNSVQRSLSVVDVPGLEVKQDQDVIRMVLPADELFQRGGAQLIPGAHEVLDAVAGAIAQHYGRQKVVIEGHTDGAPLAQPGATAHGLTTAQAYTVFETLTTRNRLPASQFATMAFGDNHPLASNGTSAGRARNRRLELVIYPETIDGN